MTTTIHTAVEGNGRPLAVVITGGQRNLVEPSFALLKQWRALATQYDKLFGLVRAIAEKP
ncbi:hypothetical protein [Mycolicibacterium sarraceniae]|uniref:Transposase n=1 Tax=Mycolicibacterium sarraceniae TaxID=1534348 RepID=A0A7I7ST16_9MYCO|nr:hypothetical protein MSAR_32830 [Mycolicibacterium sarraceniae]